MAVDAWFEIIPRDGIAWTVNTLIEAVTAWEALDSRGTPTVGCEVRLADRRGRGTVVVPSGASTGTHEAHELRDGGTRYGGRGVRQAVANIAVIAEAVRGLDAADQETLDRTLRELDGTENLSRLGANAVLGVSIATALACADAQGLPLYRAVAEAEPLLPMPMVNVVSGGAHAAQAVDIQDVLVVPVGAASFGEAIEWASRVRHATAEAAEAKGLPVALVADEGGLGPPLRSNREAVELVASGIEGAGLSPGDEAAIAIDVAATQFHNDNVYTLAREERRLDTHELLDEIADWCEAFPIVSLEDPLAEDDWDGWTAATKRLGIQVLGDDFLVTDLGRLERAIAQGAANAVLVKPNQTGTLTDAYAVVRRAKEAGYATVLSARSGDTEDAWLADLAVGWRTGQIKVGSTMRSERTAKWNRLLRIEAELGADARFATDTLGRQRWDASRAAPSS